MRIWKKPISIEELTAAHIDTAVQHLGIEFLEVGDDFIRGEAMPQRLGEGHRRLRHRPELDLPPDVQRRHDRRRDDLRQVVVDGGEEPQVAVDRDHPAEVVHQRRQPLIIVAGADYGQGSSRDWAAKGVRLAGVEVIVAEGFERIHRTNLIGMGVLPLEFKPGTTRLTLGIDGTETFDVVDARQPRATLTLVIHRKNGETIEVPVTCRLDTAEEVLVYEAGGVLQRFAQDFLEGNAA